MKLFDRILKREHDHERWLAEHPGKAALAHLPIVSAAEMQRAAARTRRLMEEELEAQRSRGYVTGPR
jgi:hypothetical protein